MLILIYVKISAPHQSEDSELWALTAILATKQTAMKRHPAESALETFAVSQHRGTVCRRPRGVDGAAVYGLGGSDTSDTSVEEGAAVRAGAPDLTIPMAVLACTVASIENDHDVCIGLYWCLYWSVFKLI